jgi:ABC-type multidrug transport system ATPase subunit
LMAVMGPSGAGLTTLLKCFNGHNNWGLSADSRVRLSSVTTIRTTFIGQNEKEFLIMGLTAKQNMIYASKLKNSREGVEMDHEMNVRTVMSDLMLTDIMDTKAESCSGGELKRLAIAVELTALHKPNLILCDEPTTGLDSNIAEVVSNGTDMSSQYILILMKTNPYSYEQVMNCLKSLVQKHDICLIASIHQPNSEIIEMCDNLYVLAKGGHCVYWGTPTYLNPHLNECNIRCNENQVPIETLITIASKGICDQTVRQLRDKTKRDFNETIDTIISQTKPKVIKNKSKCFSPKDVWILSMRSFVEIYSYKWKTLAINLTLIFTLSLIVTLAYGSKVGQISDCFIFGSLDNKTCFETMETNIEIDFNKLLI